jgi:uncharacterized protein YdeI (YjbR/CyaY-like superfamily)
MRIKVHVAPTGKTTATTVLTQDAVVHVPADFAKAMRAAGVRTTFDALAYSHRKEHVRVIEEAKKPETRQRRIDAAIAKLGS